MVRVKQEPHYDDDDHDDDVKSHLAMETFDIYQNAQCNSCIHHNVHFRGANSTFIDWYLILRVGENANIDTIRKQYLKLALLLHPDKNKHPKAEFAFKLISQAYKCLSDDGRRSSFNLERQRNLCTECIMTSHYSPNPPNNTQYKPKHPPQNSKSHKILQHLRVITGHLREEARVIESCIKLNNRGSNHECPVFDPKRYAHLGYPHRRDHHHHHHHHQHGYNFYRKSAGFGDGVIKSHDQRRRRCETPVFELRTDCSPLNVSNSSACVIS